MAGLGHSEHYYNLCDGGTCVLQKFDIVSKIRYCIQKGDIVCKYWHDTRCFFYKNILNRAWLLHVLSNYGF